MKDKNKQFQIYSESIDAAELVRDKFGSRGIANERYISPQKEDVDLEYTKSMIESFGKCGDSEEREVVVRAYVNHFVDELQKLNDQMFEQEKELRFLKESLVKGNRSIHFEIDKQLVDSNGNYQVIKESYRPSWRTMTQVRWIGLKGKKIVQGFWKKQGDALNWLKNQNK